MCILVISYLRGKLFEVLYVYCEGLNKYCVVWFLIQLIWLTLPVKMTDPYVRHCHLFPTIPCSNIWLGHNNPHALQEVTIIYSVNTSSLNEFDRNLCPYCLFGFPPLHWSHFYMHCISQYILPWIGEWLNLIIQAFNSVFMPGEQSSSVMAL